MKKKVSELPWWVRAILWLVLSPAAGVLVYLLVPKARVLDALVVGICVLVLGASEWFKKGLQWLTGNSYRDLPKPNDDRDQ